MPKRKNDMQKIISKILIESKKQKIPYLSHEQILEQVRKHKPKTKYLSRKVSQALWLLQNKDRKWNEPKILKVSKNNKTLGYTVDPLSINLWK